MNIWKAIINNGGGGSALGGGDGLGNGKYCEFCKALTSEGGTLVGENMLCKNCSVFHQISSVDQLHESFEYVVKGSIALQNLASILDDSELCNFSFTGDLFCSNQSLCQTLAVSPNPSCPTAFMIKLNSNNLRSNQIVFKVLTIYLSK